MDHNETVFCVPRSKYNEQVSRANDERDAAEDALRRVVELQKALTLAEQAFEKIASKHGYPDHQFYEQSLAIAHDMAERLASVRNGWEGKKHQPHWTWR